MPDEELTRLISARCGAPTTGDFAITADLFSDGTILDSPLSAEALTDVSKQLMKELPPFTVFGITARYVGPNALVMLETASPKATVRADDPDSERRVHVAGRILANFNRARARINQGELGSVYCDVDAKADKKWPDYGFQCPLAVDDTEAWISIAADDGRGGSEEEVASLLAHEAGWVAPPEYQRERLRLPEQVDTGTALVMAINERRERLGRRQLTFAAEQSDVMRPSYDQTFALNAQGDWDGDYPYMVQMLRGDGVDGNVWWGRIVAGIAFDGDAADWLAVRLRLPMAREDLMSEGFDQVAITTHGDPSVGFGAAAGLYKLLTAERENALVEDLARNITKIRGKRPTERLENPRGIVELAHEVSAGRQPPSALDAALRRANLGRKDNQYLAALVLPLDSSNLDASTHFEPLRAEATLKYGIVVLHARSATYNWVDPFALVWYLTRRPAGQEAERPCRPDAAIATRSPD